MRQRSDGDARAARQGDRPFERRDGVIVLSLLLEADAHPQVRHRKVGVHVDGRSTLGDRHVVAPGEHVNPRDVMMHDNR